MKKSILLRRIILLLLSAVIVSGLLSAGIYILVTQKMFVQMRIDELMPIARTVSDMMKDSYVGSDTRQSILPLLDSTNKGFLGATLHIYNDKGISIMNSDPRGGENDKPDKMLPMEPNNLALVSEADLTAVLSGEELSGVRKLPDKSSYLVVGTPITNGNEVTGAVIFTKRISELSESTNGLNLTLLISTFFSFLVMLVPGYFAAKRIVVPIRQMSDVALEMAKGDFSVRADETQKGEIGELARSMNYFAVESKRLEQTRRDYVANVSHELRTPISAIRAMGETLRDGMVKGEEKQALYYGNMVRESMRLSRLVDDLLELSRIQSGTAALKKSRFDLREVLQNVADIYRDVAQDAGLTFVLSINREQALPVFSSADRIEQVMVILLDNAIKHTPQEGFVTLAASPKESTVEICVSDTGEGIPKEDINHIFERFYKVDKSHSGGGTGLGLSIAHEIMTSLGESIRVESSPAGTSLLFTIHKEEIRKCE